MATIITALEPLGGEVGVSQRLREFNPNEHRRCIKCGKIFRRRSYISQYNWEHHHKICSVECLKSSDNKNGIRPTGVRGGRWLFKCCVCGKHIQGSKKDLVKHKHKVHAY